MDTLSQLAQSTVFSSLSKDKLKIIHNNAISKKYQKGEYATHKNDIWPYLLFVCSGEFGATKESGQGRFFLIENFKPGDVFWGLALFENEKPNPMAIQASKDGELLLWHKDQIAEIILDNPQIAWDLFSLLAKTMARAGEIVEELAFRPLSSRLANLLLDQFEGAVDNYISRDLTLDDMAARIGSTREMVCKILYQFSDKGIIDIHRTEFKINDRSKLEDIEKIKKG
jgi:CRP/FNR family transcriptional regulator